MPSIWKCIPPCKAHVIVEQMFQDNKIAPNSTPDVVYKLDPEFQKFSLNVFRTAFNELRQKHGVGLKRSSELIPDDVSCAGSSCGSSSKRPRIFETEVETGKNDLEVLDSQIVHHNQPVLMEVYQDPDTQNNKVIIVASLPGGVTDVEFSLVGSGPGTSTARITYSSPIIAFQIEAIIAKPIKDKAMPPCHPKILALKKGLQNNRDSIDDIPQGVMELTLPIPVQTTTDSISRTSGKKLTEVCF